MAINVNTVYQTVLLLLNKEQRGYITPTEFNSIATQVQLEIFEKYFEDMNQLIRVPQAEGDYSNRVANLDEKLSIFKTFGDPTYDGATTPNTPYFVLPSTDGYGATVNFYRLGVVTYNDIYGLPVETERLSRTDFYNIERSPLTKSTKSFPTYLYENNKLFINPKTINTTGDISVDYVRKPNNVLWNFTVGTLGQYIYDSSAYNPANVPATGSVNFELHESEQTDVIIKILLYAGVVIKDPQIIQIAAQTAQSNEVNSKS
tara:strand:+ start:1757 stop:2536 length:780 start_codon:yes stop_codon:yes gene_type:complete